MAACEVWCGAVAAHGDGDCGALGAEFAQELPAGAVWEFEVAEEEIGGIRRQFVQGLAKVARGVDLVPEEGEVGFECRKEDGVVLYNEDAEGVMGGCEFHVRRSVFAAQRDRGLGCAWLD